jgi:hypothetical protein
VAANAAPTGSITVGVDTHKDRHVAAVVDQTGRVLAATDVPTTVNGFARLLAWPRHTAPSTGSASRAPAPTALA